MTSERTADAEMAIDSNEVARKTLEQRDPPYAALLSVAEIEAMAALVARQATNIEALYRRRRKVEEERDALVAQHRPPTVRELQDVIANHVRNLEPVATSRGVALVVHAFLTEREEGMQNETRPPGPGEYVDPQPAAVDVAGDEREHVLSKDCWCNPTVESIEDDSIEHAQMLAQTDE